jgi:hypothetical protein
MEKEFNYNGHNYWVKVEPIINQITGQHAGYLAWVNDQRPGVLLYGQVVRDPQGAPILFGDESTALMNANVIKQSELGRR